MKIEFRDINKEELKLCDRVKELTWRHLDNIEGSQVAYAVQENFTVCILALVGGPTVGVTKRNCGDLNQPHEAERIAFVRALRNYASS